MLHATIVATASRSASAIPKPSSSRLSCATPSAFETGAPAQDYIQLYEVEPGFYLTHHELFGQHPDRPNRFTQPGSPHVTPLARDRKSTRLNSSLVAISYAVFCLKKKTPQS